jgi:RNA ligase (TIGR02306 family)
LGKVVPHPNADRLASAKVGGWKVVVLNTSKEGDLGVYFEIDSILPEVPWHNVDASKRRIRTVKLQGELSQGLFLPRNDAFPVDESMWEEGTDLTKVLGIEKRVFEETGTLPLPRKCLLTFFRSTSY